jgi:phosphatidylserine/phosphatidylglycerophosphate/cardiolipin synthase-like enzyme
MIASARAYSNNEVAYVAWTVDGMIPDCLGFEVTRVYLDDQGHETERTRCAAWVAFEGQRNPHWIPQDTGIWPVQKLSWRDLTLRKRRSRATRRPDEVRVRYEVRPLGPRVPDREAAPDPTPQMHRFVERDAKGVIVVGNDGHPNHIEAPAYEGAPRPLSYLGPVVATNDVLVTSRRGAFRSTFTNGILAAQWLSNILLSDGVITSTELIDKLENPDDPHRKYLAGDVLPLIHELFARDGEFHLALYELEDKELVQILLDNADRIHIILSNSALDTGAWDVRNAAARQALVDKGVDIQHRMFNNAHIGHNKFVVHSPPNNGPRSVLTGSTNWTATGVAGQTNNALLVEDDRVAANYLDYWNRLKDDALPIPSPFGAAMRDSCQSATFRLSNMHATEIPVPNGVTVTTWYSPNTKQKNKGTATPPDLVEVYRRLGDAKHAILFLAFYPGQKGNDCIIGEAIKIGQKQRQLIVTGAVSSPQAMPNYVKPDRTNADPTDDVAPATFEDGNVTVVRAAAIDDRTLLGDFGIEKLTAKKVGAIIHDKIVVIDPLSPNCSVILGSHNLGYKASYTNDENMLIVSGDRALAEAYAVHVLDVYDHYRFRAVETERRRLGQPKDSGFLKTNDSWLTPYVTGEKGALSNYFAAPPP